MASEKQVNYIKILIDELKPENMQWWAVSETKPERYRNHQRRSWLLQAMGIDSRAEKADGITYDMSVEMYLARIADLEETDWLSASTTEASVAITSLKDCRIVW